MDIIAKRALGRTGIDVTEASFGGGSVGNFFRVISDRDAEEVLEAAWAAGIRYYDTAPRYGRGLSERRIGDFLRSKSPDDYVISTKVGRVFHPAKGEATIEDSVFLNSLPFYFDYDYSYDGVMRSIEDSYQRLGLPRIDILNVHDIGIHMHKDQHEAQLLAFKGSGVKALEELRSAGDVKGYGLGVNEVDACMECLDYADPNCFLLAGRFTLLEQQPAKPLLEACRARGVSLIIGGVYNSGILATGAVPGARYDYKEATPEILDRVRQLERICERHCVPLVAAAQQFPLAHPAVSTILLGVGTMSSLTQNVDAFRTTIPPALWIDMVEARLLDPDLAPN